MKKKMHLLGVLPILVFLLLGSAVSAQVTGTVFRDFNGNGMRDANEPLLPGVTVNAYLANSATPCGTATTSSSTAPNYTLTGCGTAAVRVEFVLPTTGVCVNSSIDYSSFVGSANGTSVQFVNGNSTNVNFAVHNPGDYNQGTTDVTTFVPCYVNGDPLGGGDSGTTDWFVGFDYTNTGTASPEKKVDGTTLGAVWGVAYSKQAQKIFTSAFIKRHVGLGVNGSGAIYLMTETATSFTPTLFFDMDDNTFNTASNPETRTRALPSAPAYGEGSSFNLNVDRTAVTYLGGVDLLSGQFEGFGVVGSNSDRGLSASRTAPSYDPAAFDQVGKVGIGDIEISSDGKFLFVMNLFQRRIFRLELNDPANPTSVIAVTVLDFPTTTCPNGVLRPFALKFERGKLYMGALCSAENSGATDADLSAKVYVYDNATTSATLTASPILDIALDYQKGDPGSNANLPASTKFNHKWTSIADVLIPINGTTTSQQMAYPQPVLSDIEFTSDGDMILGFFDRTGHQWGSFNRQFLGDRGAGNNPLKGIYSSGDILIAGLNCTSGTYTLENSGEYTSSNGTTYTSGAANGEGPGGSEFFEGENYNGHNESAQGGMGAIKGQNEVMTISMDPLALNTGGVIRLSTVDGAKVAAYQLYSGVGSSNGLFGKAQGLGDVEFSGIEAPIEIGNRVWEDTDNDGVQDPGEPGISGLAVQLWKETTPSTFTQVATVTTNANGNYYFSNATGTSALGITYDPDVQPGMNYELRFPTTSGALAISTKPNMGGADANADARDADATTGGVIAFTTGKAGENNHTFDVGYAMASCTTPTATAAATQPTCVGSVAQSNGTITISTFTNERYQYSSGATFNSGAAIPGSITAIPVGGVIVNNLTNTTQQYTVRIYDATDDACFVDRVVSITAVTCLTCTVSINSATPTACVPATNTYSVTVEVSWTNASGTSLTVSSDAPGATNQTITTTAGSSGSSMVTFTGLTANGVTDYNITAQFDGTCTVTDAAAFDAPSGCTGCPTGNCGGTAVVKRT